MRAIWAVVIGRLRVLHEGVTHPVQLAVERGTGVGVPMRERALQHGVLPAGARATSHRRDLRSPATWALITIRARIGSTGGSRLLIRRCRRPAYQVSDVLPM